MRSSKILGPLSPAVSYFRKKFTTVRVEPSPAQISEAKKRVQEIINGNPVAIFSKSYCPYCTSAKELFAEAGAVLFGIELDHFEEEGPAMQAVLKEMNGQSTVPYIYIGQKHIGGYSDLQALGPNLRALLAKVDGLAVPGGYY